MDDDFEPLPADLSHMRSDKKLQWIFVGGKGGVGKTTTSCSLSMQLAKNRPNEKDPAHNLSDAFEQKIGDQPTLINGVGTSNLFAMETDPEAILAQATENNDALSIPGADSGDANNNENPLAFLSKFKEIAKNFPGIDEAVSFGQLMKTVKEMKFDVVIFDTAPTGHTLRLLSLPDTLNEAMGAFSNMTGPMGAAMQAAQQMMGGGDPTAAMQGMKQQIEEVRAIFQDPEKTTFVCVCIPEFLSVFETERLIQELAKFEIDCSNVVVNQVLYPEPNGNCSLCTARSAMQKKYLDQIDALYEDFHVVKMPLLKQEVRGVPAIESFSENLMNAFQPPQ